jgi:hypothetical protein
MCTLYCLDILKKILVLCCPLEEQNSNYVYYNKSDLQDDLTFFYCIPMLLLIDYFLFSNPIQVYCWDQVVRKIFASYCTLLVSSIKIKTNIFSLKIKFYLTKKILEINLSVLFFVLKNFFRNIPKFTS